MGDADASGSSVCLFAKEWPHLSLKLPESMVGPDLYAFLRSIPVDILKDMKVDPSPRGVVGSEAVPPFATDSHTSHAIAQLNSNSIFSFPNFSNFKL